MTAPRPFVKWAGGKGRIVQGLIGNLPNDVASGRIKRYIEPFVGGGALLFALTGKYGIKEFVVNDSNEALIDTYDTIKKDPESLIEKLATMEHQFLRLGNQERRQYYERKRDIFNELSRRDKNDDKLMRSSLLIFLNKTCWNGLFRLNRNGEFNVPIGRFTNPTICDSENIRSVSIALKSVKLYKEDFRVFLSRYESAGSESLMYIDPPYVVPHDNNGFLDYNEKVFSWQDQLDLASYAARFASKGVRTIISNARHNSIRELYQSADFTEHSLSRFSGIAADRSRRRRILEFVLTSYAVENSISWSSGRG